MCQYPDCAFSAVCIYCEEVRQFNDGKNPLLCVWCISETDHARHIKEFRLLLEET